MNYTETDKQRSKFLRNEKKYEKSYQEFETHNKECFDTMIRVLSNRFKIISPTVGRYFSLM